MKKIIITYGLIAGAIIIGSMIWALAMEGLNHNMAVLEWLGYLIMIIAFSAIFVGIKRYRDRDLGGVIKFVPAFLVGLGITAVASVVYVAAWEANLAITDYAFIDQYTSAIIEKKQAAGVSEAELQETRNEMTQLVAQYGNPFYRIPITFLEIFPVGLLIALVSAAILRRSSVLPANA